MAFFSLVDISIITSTVVQTAHAYYKATRPVASFLTARGGVDQYPFFNYLTKNRYVRQTQHGQSVRKGGFDRTPRTFPSDGPGHTKFQVWSMPMDVTTTRKRPLCTTRSRIVDYSQIMGLCVNRFIKNCFYAGSKLIKDTCWRFRDAGIN